MAWKHCIVNVSAVDLHGQEDHRWINRYRILLTWWLWKLTVVPLVLWPTNLNLGFISYGVLIVTSKKSPVEFLLFVQVKHMVTKCFRRHNGESSFSLNFLWVLKPSAWGCLTQTTADRQHHLLPAYMVPIKSRLHHWENSLILSKINTGFDQYGTMRQFSYIGYHYTPL